jgi:hypothetical protein
MLPFALLKGADKAVGNVSNSVKVVHDLNSSLSGTGQVDRARVFRELSGSGGG